MPKLPDPPAPHALARIAPDPYILRAGTELWRVYARGGCHPRSWNTFRSYGPVKTMRFDHHEEPVREQDRRILFLATPPVVRMRVARRQPPSGPTPRYR